MEWKLSREQATERLEHLYDFIFQYISIADSHTVDYFTENHWQRIIPEEWKVDLLSLQEPKEFLFPEKLTQGPLKEFLLTIHHLKLLSHEYVLETPPSYNNYNPSCLDQFGMCKKKVHEVEKMADLVKRIISPLGIQQVIDIGSGKGYLSESLSFQHKLKVIGIDSQPVNTQSALERCRKVEKYFGDKKQTQSYPESNSLISYPHEETIFQETLQLPLPLTVTTNNTSIGYENISSMEVGHDYTQDSTAMQKDQPTEEMSFIEHDQIVTETNNDLDRDDKGFTIGLQVKDNQSYTPLTCCLDSQSDSILDLIKHNGIRWFNVHESTALVGLHTCGDLASIIMRQFVKCDTLKVLCLVGCCYHHVTEKDDIPRDDVPGFPMSEFLLEKSATLGRNIRMLAGQNEALFCDITSGNALKSVFYRAILQVIFQQEMKLINNRENSKDFRVGRIKKYKDFIDYAKKAFSRLNLSPEQQPSDEVLDMYYHHFLPRLTEMQRFLQIRAILAPVIESLLLLDRLLFLLEHQVSSGLQTAWLHQVFSPVLSPRCFALCAFKNE